jgi:hypothetical protein
MGLLLHIGLPGQHEAGDLHTHILQHSICPAFLAGVNCHAVTANHADLASSSKCSSDSSNSWPALRRRDMAMLLPLAVLLRYVYCCSICRMRQHSWPCLLSVSDMRLCEV